jgi:predicted membrane protein
MRRELGGDQLWWPNMDRFGEDGAQVLFPVHMGWAYGNLFAWGGRILGIMSSLIRVWALGSAFGMMFGVGIELLKRLFQVCSPLPGLRRHLLRIMQSILMAQFNRIYNFLG